MNKYIPVIGLEVHIELNTLSKMFCGCDNNWFGAKPNTHTCPVCLGLPGALPVANKKAIDGCIKIGMALDCTIPLLSKFDRKNYFYPDLAKGYQISQYDQPFAINGSITLSNGKKIGITRAHMEEDTGRLMHDTINGEKVSLIDFNRSGVPLVEIVTEPDFSSAEEVKEYLQKLQQIVRYVGVADADMEKGAMRLEPNISLRPFCHPALSSRHPERSEGSKDQELDSSALPQNDMPFELPNYKVEIKNINSFNFVVDAIEYEIKRQTELLDKNQTPTQETRGWDEDKRQTISQRSKEEAAGYRYFPEPDIPPFVWTKEYLESLEKELPELPDAKKRRFMSSFNLSSYNAELLTRTIELADYFEETVRICHPEPSSRHPELSSRHPERSEGSNDITPKTIANWIINKKIDINALSPEKLIAQIIKTSRVSGISDNELTLVLKKIIEQNKQVVGDYKNGKTNAIMFLVGKAMRELQGKVKADNVRAELEKLLQ